MFTNIRRAALLAALAVSPGFAFAAPRATPKTTAAQAPAVDPAVQAKLDAVNTTTQNAIKYAQAAQKKMQSTAAKNLANSIVTDYTNVQNGLNGIAQQRGIKLGKAGDQANETAAINGLNAIPNGPRADAAFIDTEANWFETVEQQLKDLRDSTPGHDAQLKKWLDDAENVAENTLSQARQAKQQVANAQ